AEGALEKLQAHSNTTCEEVVALATIDRDLGTTFVRDLDLSPSWVERLEEGLASTAAGATELQDWKRYDQFDSAYGLDLGETAEPDAPAPQDLGASAALLGAPASKPAGINWIDPILPPIRDQMDRGTCVAFASVACLEYHLGLQAGKPQDLSEQFAYWNMVRSTGQHNLRSGFPLLRDSGVCRDATWHYYGKEIAGNDSQDPAPENAASEALNLRCTEGLQLSARSIADLKEALAARRLIAIGIPVYRSWMKSAAVRKYGNITLPVPGEVPENIGHAIALVGYQDDEDFAGGGYFVVRNSWDHYWGTESPFGSGYGTLPYRYIERFNWDAWCI